MKTKNERTEASDTSRKPLQVDRNTLKDLAPESRAAQQVKGGIPKQPDSRLPQR